VRRARRLQPLGQLGGRILWRDRAGEERQQQDEQDDRRAYGANRVRRDLASQAGQRRRTVIRT
jgi:hypothetical protein